MKIGLDFDGVIADSSELKVLGARELYNIDIPVGQFKKEIVVKEKRYLTPEEYERLQDYIYTSHSLGLSMKIVEGADAYIEKLIDSGYLFKIITSRSGRALEIAKEWLSKNNFKLDIEGVGHGFSKANACKGLDLYIDDDLEKLIDLVNVVPNRWIFSWEYNLETDDERITKRVNSWEDIFSFLSKRKGSIM